MRILVSRDGLIGCLRISISIAASNSAVHGRRRRSMWPPRYRALYGTRPDGRNPMLRRYGSGACWSSISMHGYLVTATAAAAAAASTFTAASRGSAVHGRRWRSMWPAGYRALYGTRPDGRHPMLRGYRSTAHRSSISMRRHHNDIAAAAAAAADYVADVATTATESSSADRVRRRRLMGSLPYTTSDDVCRCQW